MLCILVFMGKASLAAVSSYSFTPLSGTYDTLNGATATRLTTVEADDAGSASIAIGFSFNFDGTNYSNVRVSSNGWISFLTSSSPTSAANNLTSGGNRPLVAPLWDDLDGRPTPSQGRAFYQTLGTAPNRIFVMEWKNWEWNYSSSARAISFQVRLYESTNIIDFVYKQGPDAGNPSGSSGASIGLASVATGSGNFLSVQSIASPTVSSSSEVTTLTTKPATGQIYRFSPPVVPTITSFSPSSGCAGTTTITIRGTGFTGASAPNTRIGGTAVTSITSSSDTSIVAIIGAGTTGTVSVITSGGTGTSSGTFTVNTAPATPTVSPSSITISAGATASLTAVGAGGTYEWYATSTGGSPLFTGSTFTTPALCANTTYYLQEVNGGGCPSATRGAVTVSVPGFTMTPSNGLICVSGGSVTIDATSSFATAYSWSGASLSSYSSANPTANPTSTTAYSVTVTTPGCTGVYSANVGVISGAASVPSAIPASSCYDPSSVITLNANLSSSSFGVSSISYAPATFPASGGTIIASGGVASVPLSGGSLDDGGWSGIPIGFSFNYFGHNYSTIAAGTNGLLMFGSVPCYTTSAGCLGQYSFAGPPYFPNAGNPGNVIGLMLQDMYFGITGDLKYWNDGIAPTRRFIIEYKNVPDCCGSSNLTTVQCILYETTGIVEIHISGTASTRAKTVGLQDSSRTIGSVAPGRSGFTSTITVPEAWRFVPPSTYSFVWTPGGSTPTLGTTSVTGPTASASPYTYSVQVTNPTTGCVTNSSVSFTVNDVPAAPSVSPTTLTVLAGDTATYTASGVSGATFVWRDAATGGSVVPSTGGILNVTNCTTGTTSYYVDQTSGICTSITRTPVTLIVNPLLTPTASSSTECSNPVAPTCSVSSNNSTIAVHKFNWYDASSGGTLLQSSTSTTYTSSISSTTTFYVSEVNGSCESPRVAVTATLPAALSVVKVPTNGIICSSGGSVSLAVTPTMGGSITWSGAGLTSYSGDTTTALPSVSTVYTVTETSGSCVVSGTANVAVLAPTPFTPTASPSSSCYDPSNVITLNSNLSSSAFSVSSISYAPATFPVSGGTTIASGGIASVALSGGSLDDGGWSGIPIGFSFDYFGHNYSSISAGTNGLLMFGAVPCYTTGAGCLGQYSFSGPPYFPNTGNPGNVIGLMLQDMYFGTTGDLRYWNDGVAPTRRFIIEYNNVPDCCGSSNLTTVQCILYETTGIVEIHITGTASTRAKTVGLQDSSRTIGSVAPGRSGFTSMITVPEAWRFTPPATYSYLWTPSGSSTPTAGSTTVTGIAASASPITYNVQVTNTTTGCITNAPVSFSVNSTPTRPTSISTTECSSPAIPTCSVASTSGLSAPIFNWYSSDTGSTLLQTGTSNTYLSSISTTTTFYVSEISGVCESPRRAVTATLPTLPVVSIPSTGLICFSGGSVTLSVTPTMSGSTISWSGPSLSTHSGATTIASPSATTAYTVTETRGGCSVTGRANVGIVTGVTPTPSATPASLLTCQGPIQLNSNLSSSFFTVGSIPYAPVSLPGSGVTTLTSSGTLGVALTSGSLDDGGWGAIPLGFSYNFLGTNFTSVNVGTNGVIQFGAYDATGLSDFTYPIGLPSATEPHNIIAGCAVDLYSSVSGTIRYWNDGIAPTRRFILEYNNVPGYTTNGLHTFQIILYETTGIADVQMTQGTSTNNKTIGINNGDGTVGATAPGRSGTTDAIGTEGWRFSPPASYTFRWTPGSLLSDSTITNPVIASFSTPGTRTYTVYSTNPNTGCVIPANVSVVVNNITTNLYDTIVAGGAYLFNGIYRTATGVYRDTLPSYLGCDSILILNLRVLSSSVGGDFICGPVSFSSTGVFVETALRNLGSTNPNCDTLEGNTRLASSVAGEPLGSAAGSGGVQHTIWYTMNAPTCAATSIRFSTNSVPTNYNTRVTAFHRTVPSVCASGYVELASNDDDGVSPLPTASSIVLTPGSGLASSSTYNPGSPIYVQVSGFNGAYGDYGLIVDADAPDISLGTVTSSTIGVNFSSSLSAYGTLSNIYLRYRRVGDPASSYAQMTLPGTASSATITGLSSGVSYDIWAMYRCASEDRWVSRKLNSSTTPGCAVAISGPTVDTSGTCTRVRVTWTPTTLATRYNLYYKHIGSSSYSIMYVTAPVTSATITGLFSGTNYQFWVQSICTGGAISSSPTTTFTTCGVGAKMSNPNEEETDKGVYTYNNLEFHNLPITTISEMVNAISSDITEVNLLKTELDKDNTVVTQMLKNDLNIYPNPAKTEATISYMLPEESQIMNIKIFDVLGNELVNEIVTDPSIDGTYTINLNNYVGGMYFIKVQATNYSQTAKLVVDKD